VNEDSQKTQQITSRLVDAEALTKTVAVLMGKGEAQVERPKDSNR
jgi:hypothetical protein